MAHHGPLLLQEPHNVAAVVADEADSRPIRPIEAEERCQCGVKLSAPAPELPAAADATTHRYTGRLVMLGRITSDFDHGADPSWRDEP